MAIDVCAVKTVSGKFVFVFFQQVAVSNALNPFDIHDVINALNKCGDSVEPVSQFHRNGIKFDARHLLKISKLSDFGAVAEDLPAEPCRAERWRFPVVFFETNIVMTSINADCAQTFKINFLRIRRRRLQYHLKLMMLVKPVRIITVSPVCRSARRLDISDFPWFAAKHAEKSMRMKSSCADFFIERLCEHAAEVTPEFLQIKDNILQSFFVISHKK